MAVTSDYGSLRTPLYLRAAHPSPADLGVRPFPITLGSIEHRTCTCAPEMRNVLQVQPL